MWDRQLIESLAWFGVRAGEVKNRNVTCSVQNKQENKQISNIQL